MKRFLSKALRWAGIILATLAVLLLVFYAEEDWRGARDWAACQRDLAAKGEPLDLRQLVPPGNPADDLSNVPIFSPLFEKIPDPHAPISQVDYRLKAPLNKGEPDLSHYSKRTPLDLAAWQKFYRSLPGSGLPTKPGTPAQDVLQTLTRFNPQMDAIEVALENPNLHFPIDYERPFKPNPAVGSLIQIAAILQIRAAAFLDNGQSDLAEKDYLFSLKLSSLFSRAGGIVNYVLATSVRNMNNSILWEGIHRHAWNGPQLQDMESALTKDDWLAMGQDSFRISRVRDLQSIDTPAKEQVALQNSFFIDNNMDRLIAWFWLRPYGWNLQDKIASALYFQKQIDAINPRKGLIEPEAFIPLSPSPIEFYYVPLASVMQSVGPVEGRTIAKAETTRRLARLACRLEEYRIAHGTYPDKLDDLPDLPAHLSQEVLSMQPLQYHRQGDGYQLYSLGWNQKDDGGTYNADPQQGDWPWPSP